MLAEINGKISSTGSNLSDRLEDQLTGDFFGTLRYISFTKAMKKILLRTKLFYDQENNVLETVGNLNTRVWDDKIEFWPYDELGEFDVVIDLPEILIGIEVKLYSGISSDDDVDNTHKDVYEQSDNQLARESKILKKKVHRSNKPMLLLFIAPELYCYSTCKKVKKRNIIHKDVVLGAISWEEVLETIGQIEAEGNLNEYEMLIIQDLIKLLKRKGFKRFRNFNLNGGLSQIINDGWFDFRINEVIQLDFNVEGNSVIEGDYYEFE